MGPQGRFNPRPCRVCHGISKSKCFLCGQSFKINKRDLTSWELLQYESWIEMIEYLKEQYQKLINMRGRTTGCETLDAKILLHIGDWRPYARRLTAKELEELVK